MKADEERRQEQLGVLALCGAFLFGFTAMSVVDRLFAPPMLVVYLFVAWALFIALTALALRRPPASDDRNRDRAAERDQRRA